MSAFQGNNDATKGTYGRSAALWAGINWAQMRDDPSYGHAVIERFTPYISTPYTITQATSGTQTVYGNRYPGVVIDSGSTTAGRGPNIQHSTPFLPTTSGMIVYETLGFFSANSTGPQFFCGLHEADTTILSAAGALTSDELVGFHSVSGNTLLAKNQATGTIQSQAAGSLSTSGGIHRLGFRIIRNAKIEFWVDGVMLRTTPTSQIPSSALLYPSIVCQTNGTTQPTFTQHWWSCAMLYQSPY